MTKKKSEIQAVLFKKSLWNINNSKLKLRNMGLKLLKGKKIHTTETYHRFRIKDPKEFKSFRIKKNKKTGIDLILGFK